jgi:hypothetical protein
VSDLRGLLVATNANLTVGELFERHGGRNVLMAAWALIHGAVEVLGEKDVRFLERLGFPGGFAARK